MKPTTLILAALCAVSSAVQAAGHDCSCSHPPAPPLPPMSAMPPLPPAPPAPPAPPPLPTVPAWAHAACIGQADGARLPLTAGKRVTITGVCEKHGERMLFDLREYRRG